MLRTSHDLFFLPMHWWSVLLLAGAVISFFTTVFGARAWDKDLTRGYRVAGV